jgi:hypothetical protein
MDSETRDIVRWTVGGGLGTGLLFVVVAVGGAAAAGADVLAAAAPMAAFGMIGLTVGALVGPLMRGIWLRRRAR